MADRLTYNEDAKTIDEVVISNAFVHLEQLDDTVFMLIVENEEHHWHLRIGSRSGRAKVDAWVYEVGKGDELEMVECVSKEVVTTKQGDEVG